MKSMTGFGRATFDLPNYFVDVEASSVNKKNLEIIFSAPKEWQRHEHLVRNQVKSFIHRGRIRISISLSEQVCLGKDSFFDEEILSHDLSILENFYRKKNIAFTPNENTILKLIELRKSKNELPCLDQIRSELDDSITQALQSLLETRKNEGNSIRCDFVERIEVLESYLNEIGSLSEDSTVAYGNKLIERLKKSGLTFDLNDERILKEITLYAEKVDTTEEIIRIKSHIAQMKETINSNNSIGRKLEFLLQEISREINTFCSKSVNINSTKIALNARLELEKLREQSLNIE